MTWGEVISGVPLLLFAPLLVCLALLWCLSRRLHSWERTTVRPLALHDAGCLAATAACAAALSLLAGHITDSGLTSAAGRNVLFLTGTALLVWALAGPYAAGMAPVCWVMAVTLFGYSGPQGRSWSVIALPADHRAAAVVAVLVFAAGLASVPGTSRHAVPSAGPA
ncbi:hypothetical protein PJ985_21660 [Streptomyces sp. ACA25]|uniref:hypothetical protein n=1 Tax=Streptomyces sp. ACA25 TaxID=3022596 RepID=UPI002307E2B3|nr:hypothetical protein [Streptomyces sp. ACA25]MDB1090167.1 hypothetical protein [Streptomyces sp. ACA25]